VTTHPTIVTPQPITAPRTREAVFLVLSVADDERARTAVRALCADLPSVIRAVGTRVSDGRLSCVAAFGSDGWERLFGPPRPAQLHSFAEVRSGPRRAVSTPGDILLHIRADRRDLGYELASQVMARLQGGVSVEDEVSGFQYFDDRDLTGFVDGTENPGGLAAEAATLVGDEDAAFSGGSYVLVQKYIHDLASWDAVPTDIQEGIIGRRKLSDIELDNGVKPAWAHNALTSIEEDGVALEILRHNMPFGGAALGEAGTYFIGYARAPHVLEQMITNMFVGRPPGNYDRLLDFTRPVTGTLFFAPSASLLGELAERATGGRR